MNRLEGIDRLRGAAIVLMVVDHSLMMYGDEVLSPLVRISVTRTALPLFIFVAGTLITAEPRWWRWCQVFICGLVASSLGDQLGWSQPNILLLLAGCLVVVSAAERFSDGWWWTVLALSLMQPIFWRIAWGAYQPGELLCMMMLGRLIHPADLAAWGTGSRCFAWLAAVGRWPLTIYVGHIALFVVLDRLAWAW